ncbi:hypothetical protein BJY00DRAFT_310334 [Aspergillus carlsbadensis]|nr:hypothetical protein BJY00DRAFT_310334 [Aspergillus carlsbadensis]
MSAREIRRTKRPRVSLSCIVCRRRKVRCGREHPQCANCDRMNEECVYNPTTHNELIGHVDQVATVVQDKSPSGPEPHMKALTWAHWTPGGTGNTTSRSDEPRSPSVAGASVAGSQSRLTQATSKQATMDHIAMPHVEEAVKVPVGQDTATKTRSGTSSVMPDPPTPEPPLATSPSASRKYQDSLWGRNYLSLGRGGRARYINQAFWGIVAGNENRSDDFFDEDRNADPELPPSHISPVGMAKLLRSLPVKAVSAALLDVFFLAVWPLVPLVHRPTLQVDYDEFWDWCRDNKNNLPPQKFRDDPTFFCLLFAVLYCGAIAAPAASWTSGALKGQPRETTVQSLKAAYEMSLSSCQHLEHPTLNTLVSTLLTWPFRDWPREPMREVLAVSTTVQLAQSMGLHRDGALWPSLSPVDREIRARAWWYIVRLDVQSSMSAGLPLCCGSKALEAASMITEVCHEHSGDPNSVSSKQSIAVMFAIGYSETARLQSRTIALLETGRSLTREEFDELETAAKEHQQNINSLISRIPAQGIPERGFIPSRLVNVSPSTHPELYTDDATRPTVLGAWTRVMLTLLKFDAAILLHKSLLPLPDSSDPLSCNAWTSILQLCLSYFRILLPIYQAPAFCPYTWFHRSSIGPLQCLFLTLTYLNSFRDRQSAETPVARYYVDEILEHTVAFYRAVDRSSENDSLASGTGKGLSCPRLPQALQTLVDLHSRLDLRSTTPPPVAAGKQAGLTSTMSSIIDNVSLLEAEFSARVTELASSLTPQ